MKLLFLGVGEACDSDHGNTSISLRTAGASILLDCGFSAAHGYFKFHDDPDELDHVWISHFHGDHFFGLPLLLLRFFEMGRTKPLTFVGHTELEDKVFLAMETAYPGFFAKLTFPVQYQTIQPEIPFQLNGLSGQAAATEHSQPNLGLMLDDGSRRLYYSGDGRPTMATEAIAQGCDLIVHEAFKIENTIAGHGSIKGCLDFASSVKAKRLALVHIQRQTRKNRLAAIEQVIASAPVPTLMPEDYTVLEI